MYGDGTVVIQELLIDEGRSRRTELNRESETCYSYKLQTKRERFKKRFKEPKKLYSKCEEENHEQQMKLRSHRERQCGHSEAYCSVF
jgi:hypothetical protein